MIMTLEMRYCQNFMCFAFFYSSTLAELPDAFGICWNCLICLYSGYGFIHHQFISQTFHNFDNHLEMHTFSFSWYTTGCK